MPEICLCMIVRNEAAVVERCLRSAEGLFDRWLICDTGSEDGTEEVIRGVLKHAPGELHQRPWRSFGTNRTELMELARGHGDYLLLLDADMTVSFDRRRLSSLQADAYLLRHDEVVEYWIKRLVRADRVWRYTGETHEHLVTDGPERVEKLDAIVIHHHHDGGSRSGKLERDRSILERELAAEPQNARAAFYLAQTFRDMGDRQRAIELYRTRAAMGGWDEEVFYSLFQIGVLRAEQGNWPAAMVDLIRAWEYRPSRLEPLYELASRLRLRREYRTAHLFARYGVGRQKPDDVLYMSPWVYRWGLLFEYSICAYWVGEVRDALNACEKLLTYDDLPDDYREHVVTNRRYCVERLGSVKDAPTPARSAKGSQQRARSRSRRR